MDSLSPMAKPPSMFTLTKQSPSSSLSMSKKSATEQLTAVFQKHAERVAARSSPNSTPVSTPALSYHSIASSSTEDDDSEEYDPGNHDPCHNEEDGLSYPPAHAAPGSEHTFTTRHSEFGHCVNEQYRYVSKHRPADSTTAVGSVAKSETTEKSLTFTSLDVEEPEPAYLIILTTYFSYLLLIIVGHMRDFFGKLIWPENYVHLMPSKGYAALNSDFDSFYTRRLKLRLDDCFSRPVAGVPGRTIMLLDRTSDDYHNTFKLTGTSTRALNMSSYNYLGFAQARGGCADAVEESIKRYGISPLGARLAGGTIDLHQCAESLIARFMGTEDALITSMGFAVNSTNLPALVSKGCLVISDELNHASIRFGVRLSGASVRMFKHNDMVDLEKLLREVISQGQPRTHRPWKKILLLVEGLYSMEGTLCNLPAIIELKKRYKFYLYIDEAHSIGALGPNGRGVTDYFGIDPRNVDILMGTFTKSFGAAGGYVAGSKALISALRLRSHASTYAESMSPAVVTQVIASMCSIMGVANVSSSPSLGHSPSSSNSSQKTLTQEPSRDLALTPAGNPNNYPLSYPGRVPSTALPTWLNLPPQLLSGAEGKTRLRRLAFNARYLALALKKLGFITYGHPSSPIVPLLLFHPGKMGALSRFMLERRTPIVVVVVGYPATPLTLARARFCLSAAHTKEDVDTLLEACDEIGEWLDLKRGCPKKERWTLEEVKRRAVELVEGNN